MMKKLINLVALVMLVSMNVLTPFSYAELENEAGIPENDGVLSEREIENIEELGEIHDNLKVNSEEGEEFSGDKIENVEESEVMLENIGEENLELQEIQGPISMEVVPDTTVTLLMGVSFNSKIKKLANGGIDVDPSDPDENIHNFQRVYEIPVGVTTGEISLAGEEYPVYAWFTGGTLYYATRAESIYMNKNSSYMFEYMQGLTGLDLSGWNTSGVTNMSYMFQNCNNLIKLDVSRFDTSSVTSMGAMFAGCTQLKILNVNNWDTSNVTNMAQMFINCTNLTGLDLSSWNTSSVTNMSSMFGACDKLETVYVSAGFVTTSVTNSTDMFKEATKLVGGKGTVYDADHIDAEYARIDGVNGLSGYFTKKFVSSNATFLPGTDFNLVIKSLASGTNLLYNDTDYKITKILPAGSMPTGVTTGLLSTNNSEYPVYGWFDHGTIYYYTETDKIYLNEDSSEMFYELRDLEEIDMSNWDTSNVINMELMFQGSESLTGLNLSNWDTSNVTDMSNMFGKCTNLENIDFGGWDTSNVTDMSEMFAGCNSLRNLDLSNRDTSNVTNMQWMFADCWSLIWLDLSSFDTSNVTGMAVMFDSCGSLKKIYVSTGFVTTAVTDSSYMFRQDTSLVGGNGTTYDPDYVDAEYARIDGVNGLSGYFTAKNVTGNVATLLPGEEFNEVLKALAGDSNSAIYTENTSITQILQWTGNEISATTTGRISATGSNNEIVAWFDNGTIYYYTDADDIYFNENSDYMFSFLSVLTDISALSGWKTNNITNMVAMFSSCDNLTDISALSGWNTSNVKDMSSMFRDCENLADISALSNWDTSNVESIGGMFLGCESLIEIDLSKWDTSNVTNMREMFSNCGNLTKVNLNNWNTSNVTDMTKMFRDCSKLTDISALSGWNTSNVKYMYQMFLRCENLADISALSGWNTSNVENMNYMFGGCDSLTEINLSNWDLSNIQDLDYMFAECDNLVKIDLRNWNLSNIKSIKRIFRDCGKLTDISTLSGWNTSNIENMWGLFDGCESLTDISALSGWDTSNVKDMGNMFEGCSSLTDVSPLSNWNTSNVTGMSEIFRWCSSLTGISPLSNWNTSKVTSMYEMFDGCSSLTDVSALSNWNTSNVTSMEEIFRGCSSLTGVSSLSNWDTSSVTVMRSMFDGCSNLTDVSALSGWNTSNVASMSDMFDGCSSLTGIDLTNWDTSNVEGMGGMFNGCNNLEKIYASNKFTTENVTYSNFMFKGCTKLVGGNGTVYDESHVDVEYARIDGVNGLSGYFTEKIIEPSGEGITVGSDGSINVVRSDINLTVAGENLSGTYRRGNNIAGDTTTYIGSEYNNRWGGNEDNVGNGYNSGLTPERQGPCSDGWHVPSAGERNDLIVAWCNIDSGCIFDQDTYEDLGFLLDEDGIGYGDMFKETFNMGVGSEFYFWSSTPYQNGDNDYSYVATIEDENILPYNEDLRSRANYVRCFKDYPGETTAILLHGTGFNEVLKTLAGGDNPDYDSLNTSITQIIYTGTIPVGAITGAVSISGSFLPVVAGYKDGIIYLTTKADKIYLNSDSSHMFDSFSGLVSIDTVKWDTSDVEDMNSMFKGCHSLENLDVSGWDMKNVKNMSFMFYDCNSLLDLSVDAWDTSNVENMTAMFYGCYNLKNLDLREWNVGSLITTRMMFYGCSSLTGLIMDNWETSNVENMSYMFYNCSGLQSIGVSGWNTSKVTDMESIFDGCHSLENLNVREWNTSNVENMNSMFSSCSTLISLDLGKWNTSKVTDMESVFEGCNSLQNLDVSNWDTSNVTNMVSVFENCQNLTGLNVSNWNTSNVENMTSLFRNCQNLVSLDLTKWDVNKVKNTPYMFEGCSGLTTIYVSSKFNLSGINYSANMFSNAVSLIGGSGTKYDANHVDAEYARIDGLNGLSGYFTKGNIKATLLPGEEFNVVLKRLAGDSNPNIYSGNTSITQILQWTGNTILSGVTTTGRISMTGSDNEVIAWFDNGTIYYYTEAETIYMNSDSSFMFSFMTFLEDVDLSNWDTSNVTNMSYMFYRCGNLTGLDVSNWDVGNVTNMSYMFYGCLYLKDLDVSNWDVGNVTNMNSMFAGCTQLKSLDVSNWNVGNVTNMSSIFASCFSLKSIDVSNWNTSNVTGMAGMFLSCYTLTELDISNFNTNGVTKFTNMFNSCYNLTTIYVSTGFVVSGVASSDDMFLDGINLVGGNGTVYDSGHIDLTYAKIDGVNGLSGYFTNKNSITVRFINTIDGSQTTATFSKGQKLTLPAVNGYDAKGGYLDQAMTQQVDLEAGVDGYTEIYVKYERKSSGGGGGGSSGGGSGGGGSSSSSSSSSTGSNVSSGSNNGKTDNNSTGSVLTGTNVKTNTGEKSNITTGTNENTKDNLVDSNKTQNGNSQNGVDDKKTLGYNQELVDAYNFAYRNGITTMPTIEKANVYKGLTRIAMAKMLSQYAINVLGKKPDKTKNKKFGDVSDELDKQYNNGVTLAYQLGIMGQNMPNNNFRPDDTITRAEFATALSRLLYNTSDGNPYYVPHIQKLKKEGIILNDNPNMKESRGYVMIMLMRSAK